MQTYHNRLQLLSSIKRHLLDFDYEKVCSISLSNINIYCCLVCGRYFQGKGKNTHAYEHSLESEHSLFINLDNEKQFKENIEDIKHNLNPKFTINDIQNIQNGIQTLQNLDGKQYIRGCVGMNNLKHTQFANVILMMLAHNQDVYKHFLMNDYDSGLLRSFGRLVKKIWNSQNFKGLVNPHEFMQKIAEDSNKKFQIGQKNDPITLFVWLINKLEQELKLRKSQFSIKKLFSGKLKISSFRPLKNASGYQQNSSKVEQVPFLMLSLDVPKQKQRLSQISINNLLLKYQAQVPCDTPQNRKYYYITKYPKYLVIVLKRFTENSFFKQKNSGIIQFPLQLKISNNMYRLISSICHEGPVNSSVYKLHLLRVNKWFLVHDLHVDEVLPKQITISQSYIQIYEKI